MSLAGGVGTIGASLVMNQGPAENGRPNDDRSKRRQDDERPSVRRQLLERDTQKPPPCGPCRKDNCEGSVQCPAGHGKKERNGGTAAFHV